MSDDHRPAPADEPGEHTSAATGAQPRPTATARGRRPRLPGLALAATVALTLSGIFVPDGRPIVSAGQVPHSSIGQESAGTVEPVVPRRVDDAELAALPQATTFGTVPDAPLDEDTTVPSGRVLHPSKTVPVYLAPGDRAIAALPPLQLVNDTWVPVIEQRPGWARVLLPSRPAHATGWLSTSDWRITSARTSHHIVVDRSSFTMTLFDDDREIGRWRVGIGKPESPTPAGRTFVLANIRETQPTFSPVVLPLGTHSATFTEYGGGPGTVGIHTWPTGEVYGTASSDGCLRVPPDALDILSSQVPLGTPVLIS